MTYLRTTNLRALPIQATITLAGGPERQLNTTYDRIAYESINKGDELSIHTVVCFRSGYGASLYQINKGNWCLSIKGKEAWKTMSYDYITLDRDTDAYGHAPGSELTW